MRGIEARRIVMWLVGIVVFVVLVRVVFYIYDRYPLEHLHSMNSLHRSYHRANHEHEHSVIGDKKHLDEKEHLDAVEQLHQSLHQADHDHDDDEIP